MIKEIFHTFKKQAGELSTDTIIRRVIKLFVFLILLFLIIIIWKWRVLSPQLPMFYSLPKSPDQLGTPTTLLLLPLLSFLFFGIDFTLASLFYPKERVASVILVFIGLVTTVLFLITFIKIVFLIS